MSEQWKVGDKAYVEVGIKEVHENETATIKIDGDMCHRLISLDRLTTIPPSQPAPVDVSAIRVGDEVTVRGVVVSEASPMREKVLVEFHESLSGWVSERLIASHTPAPRPTTLAEFEALPLKVRERLFAEMVKDGAK